MYCLSLLEFNYSSIAGHLLLKKGKQNAMLAIIMLQSVTPTTYIAAHRTDPPPNQVITTDPRNILLRHFYQKSENKLRPKRAAVDNLAPQNGKQPRGPGGGSQSSTRS
ncbi:hypothetical protein QYE76_071267 [Lolium multiflorum]|uniref:DET1- and DDB1-associated protein 1 domain-containing protein n=1 Tax=Lolium multiflorum TaxID=4521 RepID=A0AAD8WGN9_LOLMU|nr:hypothetical protein QYE76_071267 [Lolium multiflorum]